MSALTPEGLLNQACNRYELVILASRRVRELTEGAKPLVKIDSDNPLSIALAEIAAGKVTGSPRRRLKS